MTSKITNASLESKNHKNRIEREIQNPLWFEINKKGFVELTGHIYNNQGNNDFKIIIKKAYDLKNANKIWMEITTCKTTKSEGKNCITN